MWSCEVRALDGGSRTQHLKLAPVAVVRKVYVARGPRPPGPLPAGLRGRVVVDHNPHTFWSSVGPWYHYYPSHAHVNMSLLTHVTRCTCTCACDMCMHMHMHM